jgi:uncharacterized membrane protein YfcA
LEVICVLSWSAPKLIELGSLGVAAGALNAAAGRGSLLTFPALVAFGLPSLSTNLTNTVAQCPGYATVARGSRPDLSGQRGRIRELFLPAVVGGGAGIAALELAPPHAFRVVAPALVLVACGLLAAQPLIARALPRLTGGSRTRSGMHVAVAIACAYAAYFGAAAGVLLLAVLTLFMADRLQRLNALNRLLIFVVNLFAAILFALLGPVSWPAIAVLAPTTAVGGRGGVFLARRLGSTALRTVVLLIGAIAAGYLIATSW